MIAAAAFTFMNWLVPLSNNGDRTFFELWGGSASAKLTPIGRLQHGEFSDDEGVLEEPGNGTILYWAKRME